MFNTTVDSVLKTFNKTLTKLDKIATKKAAAAALHQNEAVLADAEARRALSVRNKLADLVA